MKKYRILLYLILGTVFLIAATQVLASPSDTVQGKKTPLPTTPGAQATEKSNDKAPKQADKPPKGKHENFKGTVSAMEAASLTLTLRDGSSVTVSLVADTRFKFPGHKSSLDTLQTGMNVMVQAIRDQGSNLVARSVMVIPGKPTKIHRVGIVTAYTVGASITIQDKDGNTYAFALTSETKLLPAERVGMLGVGSRVTIIAPRDPASGGVTVKGIVIHPATP